MSVHRYGVAAMAATVLAILVAGAASAVTTATQGWSTYRNERFGFQLSYPGGLFVEVPTPNPDSGAVWKSIDGEARLIATAAPNEAAESLENYRSFVMSQSYADAKFDYTPVKDSWFVLSGTKGDTIFYERITFVCQGRYIYGWQMNYPAAQKRKYDAIVEAIHLRYKVGRGDGGSCEPAAQ